MHTATGSTSTFNRDIIRLAVPIVLQNLVTTAVNSADVIMLGFVGQDALAAGSLANQVIFILNLVFVGILSGVNKALPSSLHSGFPVRLILWNLNFSRTGGLGAAIPSSLYVTE